MDKYRVPDYAEKISPYGMYVPGVGQIHSPRLKDIYAPGCGLRFYRYMLSVVMMTPKEYIGHLAEVLGLPNPYDELSNEEKNELSLFRLMTGNPKDRVDLCLFLSLFILGNIEWNEEKQCYTVNAVFDNAAAIADGVIDDGNFYSVIKLCLRFADVNDDPPEIMKFKNESARKFYEEFQAKKAKYNSSKRPD